MNAIIRLAHDTPFTKRYVCATCWGDLGIEFKGDPEHYYCLRGPALCSGRGFVTRRYAERRRSESFAEILEVRRNYPDLEGKRANKSAQAVLAELGF